MCGQDRLLNCKESFAVYEGDLVSLLNIYRQYEVYRHLGEKRRTPPGLRRPRLGLGKAASSKHQVAGKGSEGANGISLETVPSR